MTGLLLAVAVAAASAGEAPDEAYRKGAAAYEAGELGEAGKLLAEFRRANPDHPLAWQAGLLWARSTTEIGESERRFRDLAAQAPAATKAECELELAHLALLRDDAAHAEEAYAAWLAAHPREERAEEAAYWQAVCQAALGRRDEAAVAWKRLRDQGHQPGWRAQAGLSLATQALEQGHAVEARAGALALVEASWAKDVRPQAQLVAGKAARVLKRESEARRLLAALAKDWPELPEGREARALLGKSSPRGPRYGVQVGAFARRAAAEAERDRLAQAGHPAIVDKRAHGGLTLYGVILGPFADRAAADQARAKLHDEGTEAFVVAY